MMTFRSNTPVKTWGGDAYELSTTYKYLQYMFGGAVRLQMAWECGKKIRSVIPSPTPVLLRWSYKHREIHQVRLPQ